jgi:enterochelin esterase-like enzyme
MVWILRIVAAALAALLSCGSHAYAQTPLSVGQPVEREIAPGGSQLFAIDLDAGEYVAGTVDRRGVPVVLRVLQPDGSRLRDFVGPPQGKRPFAFVAEAAGTYRFDLTAPPIADVANSVVQSGRFELSITEKVSLDDRLKQTPSQPSSPTIKALRAQVARGAKSTEAFWQMIAEKGTPLVEPLEGNPRYILVTFLWRGQPNTRNVAVIGTFMKEPLAEVMTRLDDTDVWYRTDTVLSGARFVYLLSPNSPVIFEGPRAAEQIATLQADPLNRRRWACEPDASKFECQSIVELPGAVPQPWIVRQPGRPEGKVERYRIKSEVLKNERSLSVYTPPGYRADGPPNALLVIFDGDAYINLVPTNVILDNLISASKIPPAVAILVGNVDRNKELPPNPDFADFLAKELIPWAHAHFNVTKNPKQTVVGGSSYGAIAAAYAGLRHSEVFGKILCQSGSFMWAPDHVSGPNVDASTETGWLSKEYIKSPKLPLQFHIDAGVFEVDRFASGGAILESSRQMRDVLLAKGYEVHYQQFVGGHDYLGWRGTFPDGLIALIGRK